MTVETKIWEDRIISQFDDNLIIYFQFPSWETDSDYEISIKIYWKKDSEYYYNPGNITFFKPCKIHHTFPNGITIKGTLELKKFIGIDSNHTHGVFADFYYYISEKENYIWHTEGFLISFLLGKEKIIIIDIPDTTDNENTGIPIVNSPTTANGYSDLFPYIYASGWPTINEIQEEINFFTYTVPETDPPISSTFINELIDLKKAGDRTGMQEAAIFFIETNPDYVKSVALINNHIRLFLPLYNDYKKHRKFTEAILIIPSFLDDSIENITSYLKSYDYLIEKEHLWESYFALVIEMGYQNHNLKEIIQTLTFCNFIETIFNNLDAEKSIILLDEIVLKNLFEATIILYKDIFPLPPYEPLSSETTSITPYAIGNLQLVKYKLLRHELGEIARITSIMPGEKRKLINRKLDRIINKEVTKTSSTSTSITKSQEQNNDFNEELWNAIAETTETTTYPDPGLVSSYGPPTNITIKGSFTKSYTTQTPDKKQIASFAKKVLSKTTQRLTERINKVRAHTELKEKEDTAISYLDNSKSNEPAYGVYSWLNKIYQAKVINYGNRMLFRFIIPNPASSFIQQTETLGGIDLEEPKSLTDFNITKYEDVTVDNYLELCQFYNLKKFPLYPQEPIIVSDVLTLSQSKLISLPHGYWASKASIDYAFGAGEAEATVTGFIGQNTFTLNRSEGLTNTISFPNLNNEQNTISIGVVYSPTIEMTTTSSELNFQMSVEVTCNPSSQTILAWQIEIYQALYEAYTLEITHYNEKINPTLQKKEIVNPLTERLLVKLELEKSIKKQLLENALAVNGLSSSLINTTSSPSIQYNQPEDLQYIATTLEWNEMSYSFLDEYDNQSNLFAVSSLSPEYFSAFLKASYACIIIPVVPAFNYSFLYYLKTGIVWSIQDDLCPCFDDSSENSPDQLSVIYELKKTFHHNYQKEETIDTWEVLVPTSMQILQNKLKL